MGNSASAAAAVNSAAPPSLAVLQATHVPDSANLFLRLSPSHVESFLVHRGSLGSLLVDSDTPLHEFLSNVLSTAAPPSHLVQCFACPAAASDAPGGFLRPAADLPRYDTQSSAPRALLDSWFASQLPGLAQHVRTVLKSVRMPPVNAPPLAAEIPAATPPTPPSLLSAADCLVLELAGLAPASCPDWPRTVLYNSSTDGLSFETLANNITGYGPVLVVIRDARGLVFGAHATGAFQETAKMAPSPPGAALFQLSPCLRVYRKVGSRDASQYLNVRSKTLVHGLAFGGDVQSARLFLDQEFEACRAGAFDDTYEPGALLGGVDPVEDAFRVDCVQVWGLGGDDALSARAEVRTNRDKIILQKRQVDKRKFADNAFDREFLLGQTFGHQASKEGGSN